MNLSKLLIPYKNLHSKPVRSMMGGVEKGDQIVRKKHLDHISIFSDQM